MATGTRSLQPSGPACSPTLVEGRGPHPAVCRSAAGLEPSLLGLLAAASEPAVLTLRTSATSALALPPQPLVDLRRPRPVTVPLTFTCGDEPGTEAGTVEAAVGLSVVARLPWTLRCVAPPGAPVVPDRPLRPGPPVLGGLPPVGAAPAPPAPAQPQAQVQTQVQAQAQPQAMLQDEEAVQLALAAAGWAEQQESQEQAATFVTAVSAAALGAAGAVAARTARRQARQRA